MAWWAVFCDPESGPVFGNAWAETYVGEGGAERFRHLRALHESDTAPTLFTGEETLVVREIEVFQISQ
jgi:hypothetical protein